MGKKRRKPASRDLDPRVAMNGSIPWSGEEFWAIADEEMRLMDTPHDDWNRNLPSLRFKGEDGAAPSTLRFNPDKRDNQVMHIMVERYRDLDNTARISHMNRYMLMKQFMHEQRARLIADEFIRPTAGQPDEIAMALLDVLAEQPFVMAEDGRYASGEIFDYARVTAAAWRLMAAEDADEAGQADGPRPDSPT